MDGWRVWRIGGAPSAPRLVSPWHRDVWEPGDGFRAVCGRSRHSAPHEHCTCGVYVSPDASSAWRGGFAWVPAALRGPGLRAVVGVVRLSGDVLPCESLPGDWRGEHARIVHLFVDRKVLGVAGALQDEYGVNVERVPDIRRVGLSPMGAF